jgi:hypothetical protein
MSLKRVLLAVAAGVAGVGAVWSLGSRGNPRPQAAPTPREPGWHRATRLATAQDHPGALTTDGEYVYYMTGGFQRAENAIRRVPVLGGPSEVLAQGGFVPTGGIAADEEYVYWTSSTQPSVLRVPKAGGPPQIVLQKLPQAPRELALDGTHVYIATFRKDTPGFIVRVPKSGGATQTLISGRDALHGLLPEDSGLFFVGGQEILKISREGGEVQTLLPKTDRVAAIRLLTDSQNLYFFHEQETIGRYALARMPRAGGPLTILTRRGTALKQLAQSETHLYFFDSAEHDVLLVRVPKAGGDVETVDIGSHATGALSLHGGNLYFTDIDSVYRLPR